MEILFDHQAFTMQEHGGISRYFYELNREFQASLDINVNNSIFFSNNEYIRQSNIIKSTAFFKCVKSQKKIQAMRLLNEFKSKFLYKQNNFDLFHPTYYDPYYLEIKSKKPVIVTFYDLIHEKFMQYDYRTLTNKRKVLNRADMVIAISQHSKNDLIEHFRIPEKRIVVIHLASSFTSTEDIAKTSSEDEYILFVGNRNHYKNFQFFTKAIAPLLQEHANLHLFCAGGGDFTKEELVLFRELRIGKKVKFQQCHDEELKNIYCNAVAFFFPSMYEGFGLPLLEAMNCGCPIGASYSSSLPEVAGDAAIYFNPYDRKSILTAAQTLISDPKMRSSLRKKGFSRANEFSWKKTAELTRQAYGSMI